MTLKTIAVDAMGGDFGPSVTVPAALKILQNHKKLKLILVGDESTLKQMLDQQQASKVRNRIEIQHASEVVGMDEPPAQAVRRKRDSSMRVAVNLVKEGRADSCVSAGNTGALMATSHLVLRTLPGVDRPAIMASFPAVNGKEVHMLDLGANVDSSAKHLLQFAVMGSIAVSAIKGIKKPKVALLNVGEEEIKGNEQVKQTAQYLSSAKSINYKGYIEGDAIFKGVADVVVCDGFVGNVTLKAVEGATKLIAENLRDVISSGWFTKLCGFLALPIFKSLKGELDPGKRNGASFLGLQGVVVKSHGGADINAFACALEKAITEAEMDIPQHISEQVKEILDSFDSEDN